MTKINQEEYEVLKALDDKWKWIARDDENQTYSAEVYVFEGKPEREDGYWNNVIAHDYALLEEWDDLFQFIQWEDEEPNNIAELIEEYENSPEYVTYISNERTRILSNDLWSKLESEETEVKKDLKWLKNQADKLETTIRNLIDSSTTHRTRISLNGSLATLKELRELINQLDEPEVLSQEWMDEHKESWQDLSVTGYSVPEKDLQNLLVPKQEREQKYNVKFKVKSSFGTVGIFLYKKGDEVLAGDNFRAYYPKEDEYRLTEQEIRDFQNGDILFEHFAVKVEELEE